MNRLARDKNSRWLVPIFGLVTPLLFGAADTVYGAAVLSLDNRGISALAEVSGDSSEPESSFGELFPASPFAPWTDFVSANVASRPGETSSFAAQVGAVSPTLFTGDGVAGAFVSLVSAAASGSGVGNSEFAIDFELLTPHSFLLTGLLSREGEGSLAQLSIGSLLFTTDDGVLAIDEAGVLDAGSYHFNVFAETALGPSGVTLAIGSADFQFEFALTDLGTGQVPQPATLFLVALGIGAAGVRHWRKNLRP